MPSFDYKTNPIIYYPDSITVDTHDCTIEDIPENERPVKGMTKCLRCEANDQNSGNGTQYIDFGEITIYRDKDFSIDFWFNTTSKNHSRIIDFTIGNNQGIKYDTDGCTGNHFVNSTEGWSFGDSRRNRWNHFCWQYISAWRMQRLYFNGKIEQEYNLDIQDTVFPYTYLGRCYVSEDPMINCRYAGIRLQYGLVMNNLDARSLKYFNTTMSNLKTT